MSLRSAVLARLKRDPVALRERVLRERRTQYQPDEPENPFRRTGRLGILQDAVEFRQQVAFFYTNKDEDNPKTGRRVGNPHGVFKRDGKTYLLMYAIPGSSSGSGRLPGWRTYLVSRIQNPQIIVRRAGFGEGYQQFRIAPGFGRFRRLRFIFRV